MLRVHVHHTDRTRNPTRLCHQCALSTAFDAPPPYPPFPTNLRPVPHPSPQVELKRELAEKKAEGEKLKKRAEDMMRLKFGRVVDLEEFEGQTINKRAEELKDELGGYDAECRREIAALDQQLQEAKQTMTRTLRDNSARLAALADLSHDKRSLERQLDDAQRLVSAGKSRKKEREAEDELENLRRLAGMQAAQLDQLREQIARLSRKSGHVLPPSKQGTVERLPPL